MKKYRRIEITAFRRRITIISGGAINSTTNGDEVCINDADTQQAIEPESDEGQRVLLEAVRLLEEKLAYNAPKDS